jgi:hypothetical protein
MNTKTDEVRQYESQDTKYPNVDKCTQSTHNPAPFEPPKKSELFVLQMSTAIRTMGFAMKGFAPEQNLEEMKVLAGDAWAFISQQADDVKKDMASIWRDLNDTLLDYSQWLEAVGR